MTTLIPKFEQSGAAVNRPYNLKLQESVSVKDFGAIGDGTTDDTSAIQAALDYMYNAGGGRVYLPAGTYKTSLPLIVLSNVTFEGDGAGSVIYQSYGSDPGDAANGIQIGYGYGWSSHGANYAPYAGLDATTTQLLAYDYSRLTTKNAAVKNIYVKAAYGGQRLGVWVINSFNCLVENIWSENFRTPVNISNDNPASPGASANITVNGVFQVSSDPTLSWYDVLYIGNCVNIIATNLHNNPNTPSTLEQMVITSGAFNVTISNSVFTWNSAHGADKYGFAATASSSDVTVTGCVFRNLTVGASVGDASGTSTNVSIVGNVFDSNYIAIQVVKGSKFVTSPNIISNSSYADVYTAGGIPPFGCNQTEWVNAKWTYCGTGALGSFYDTSGNFTVGGQNSYNGKLNVTFDGAASNGLVTYNTSSILTGQYAIRFAQNGTYVGSIQTTGTATAYVTSSDYRLKDNVVPMSNALDVVSKLNPVTYTWKATGEQGQGFIAHELQSVIPEAVTGAKDAMATEQYVVTPEIPAVVDENGKIVKEGSHAVYGEREVPAYQGIDTSFIVATLTKAIQELKAEIDTLKAGK
jgi:hypothetical protein